MSYWFADFKRAFFGEWVRAGLPDPERVPPADRGAWREYALPEDLAVRLKGVTGTALSRDVVSEVYGFGALIGHTCGELFRLAPKVRAERSDWCGRFNLGISLFDYICDEQSSDPFASIGALPAFAPFMVGKKPDGRGDIGELGAFLESLAGGLLGKLSQEVGEPRLRRKRFGLWRTLTEMFSAEMWVATNPPVAGANVPKIIGRLRTKSSEPFRIMSEWMARGGRHSAKVSPRRAAHFGRAMGDCFWMVDDAQDVWEDLDAGRWNYFLAAAASLDPGIPLQSSNPVVESRLANIWKRHGVAGKAAQATVRRFLRALTGLGAAKKITFRSTGRLVHSMANWSR